MSKLRAFSTHLAVSGLALLAFLTVVMVVWYPAPYFEVDGGWTVLQILIGVDLVLGPLLTLIVFKPNKPSLKFDMSCIALMQLAALVYGGWTIYQGRPDFVVFAVDRFITVAAVEYDKTKLQYPELDAPRINGPHIALALLPDDPKAREDLLFGAAGGGRDLEQSAQYYHPYQPDLEVLSARSVDLTQIMPHSEAAATEIKEFLNDREGQLDDFFYFPLVGKNKDVVMALNADDGQPVGVISIDPWLSSYRPRPQPGATDTQASVAADAPADTDLAAVPEQVEQL